MNKIKINEYNSGYVKVLNFALEIYPEFKAEYEDMMRSMPYLIKCEYEKFEDFSIVELNVGANLVDVNGCDKVFSLKTIDKTYKLYVKKLNNALYKSMAQEDLDIVAFIVKKHDEKVSKNFYISLKNNDEKSCRVQRIYELDNMSSLHVEDRRYNDDILLSFSDVKQMLYANVEDGCNL